MRKRNLGVVGRRRIQQMKFKVRRNKKSNGLNKLRDKLLALNKQSVSIGYFKEQGLHPYAGSGITYASLAYIHAHGHEFGYPTRNIFPHIKPVVGGFPQQSRFFGNLIKNYVQVKSSYTLENLLDDVGRKYQQDGKSVFGNTALLDDAGGSNPDPLINEGHLKDAFAYKTTFNYKVVTNG